MKMPQKKMKLIYNFCLLAALTVAITGLQFKKHTFVNIPSGWFAAQAYCRSKYADLSTIDSPEEFKRFRNQTAANCPTYCWIGLNKQPTEKTFTLWSDGSSVQTNNLKWFTYQPDHPYTEHCGVANSNGLFDCDCYEPLSFFCYTWEPKLFVVKLEKTWDEALKHCRTFYTDIMSLNSKTDLDFFNNVTSGIQIPGFWTGLHFHDGSWYWVNGDGLGSLFSPPSCPIYPFVCGSLMPGNNALENRDCKEKKPFVCYI